MFPHDLISHFGFNYMPLRPLRLLCLCLLMGGKCFVRLWPQSFSSFELPTFFNRDSPLFKRASSVYAAIWECNWHSLDNGDSRPQIPAVDMIPCSVFVRLSQYEWSDSTVVPLPSPCGRVLGQVALVASV
ncbi:hypothetical protein GOODEAATRI_001084 [Goodea atripinnis]|uniref:Secreted protein n=1 Tax=Goodea atripinnis TaxID=208336 RepID=A0ABV0PJS2_9TELE